MTPPPVSAAAYALYAALGDVLIGPDPLLGYPLLALCEAIVGGMQDVDDLAADSDAGPGWSALLDAARAPTYVLPWQAQFVGTVVDPGSSDATQRAVIAAEGGFARGTPAAMLAAAAPYLSVGQGVRLIERAGGNPYAVQVTVFGSAVVGQSYGDLSREYPAYTDLIGAFGTYGAFATGIDELTAAIAAAKPAGLVLTVIVSSGQLYSDLTAGAWGGSYSATSAHYPTYAAMTNAPPGT